MQSLFKIISVSFFALTCVCRTSIAGDITSAEGKLIWNGLEGGFWALIIDNQQGGYDLSPTLPHDKDMFQAGDRVRITGKVEKEAESIHMWGELFNVSKMDDLSSKKTYVFLTLEEDNYIIAHSTDPAQKAQALYESGTLLSHKGYYSDAVSRWADVIAQYNSSIYRIKSYWSKGETEYALGKLQDALQTYQGLVDQYPASKEAAKARDRLQSLGRAISADKTTKKL